MGSATPQIGIISGEVKLSFHLFFFLIGTFFGSRNVLWEHKMILVFFKRWRISNEPVAIQRKDTDIEMV